MNFCYFVFGFRKSLVDLLEQFSFRLFRTEEHLRGYAINLREHALSVVESEESAT